MSGEIISDGGSPIISHSGVCWSSNSIPSLNNDKTNEGAGNGSFSSSLIDLKPDTKYYISAYAINESDTAYGNIISFKTSILEKGQVIAAAGEQHSLAIKADGALWAGEVTHMVNWAMNNNWKK
ncbi:MAG: hypothetical protein U5K54_14060 [Cytophagales bacterium]|nr:hypothetical protein [Cytophagales bacterium]